MKYFYYFYFKIFLAIALILSLIAIWNYTLILGWLFSFFSVASFLLSKHLFFSAITKKAKNKEKTSSFFAFFIYIILILFQAAILIVIFFINKSFQTAAENSYDFLLGPINIISFIFGYTIFPISAIIYFLLSKHKKIKE
ncbi:hypothetical protein [Mesomycoplasma ovipneumoniae]|uniref:hypothetical protein n=1 Tax=Mesomycoplasma ovipneumoniae TaxID=29562 RepID=UPI00296508D8|nr:hypothetical protein [Mesomycoplasma ovipneumoniae]MDW2912570.1 hypothetical protein [Mesomycoplasma ovipneumoniae]MDW2921158.1 hypothetical protein [Mesomycoplasma ovipneumoniae]MDW2925376.1 hypothetical protein [Mesomycoplasma ovipneumoniae]MDW2927463.1 hypothetical protein [Mesomycoplasma ovipneumoniae]MDW2933813.1 hypothetical protein [Mesomycoplasma ovipneumoniae]